jgi:peptidyl-prolyl cis-trans isomerase D
MISFFRSNRRGIVGIFLIGMCVMLMLPFGVDYFGNGPVNKGHVAKINGTEISLREYDMQLYGVRARLRQQFGENFQQIETMLNLKQKVLDDMIDEKVLTEFFSESKFEIGVGHIEAYIKTLPMFKEGVTREKLLSLLKAQGMSENKFEKDVKNSLLREQLNDVFLLASTVSQEELKKRYAESHKKITVAYGKVSASQSKIEVSDDEISKYYSANEKNFMTERLFEVISLKFPYAYYTSKVSVHEEDLQDAYKNNKLAYEVPAKVMLEQLVFTKKAPDFLGENVVKEEQKNLDILANATREEVVANPVDFKKIGESKGATYLLDNNLKEASLLPKEVQAVLNDLKEADISEVIESGSSFYIIKVKKIEPSFVKPLEEVKVELEKSVRQSLAPEMALFAAQEFKEKLNGIDLTKAKEDIKNRAEQDKFEVKNSKGNKISLPSEVASAIENQNANESGLVESQDGVIVYYVSSVVEKTLKPLLDVKNDISQLLKKEKQIEADKVLAKELIVLARNAGENVTFNGFSEIIKKKNITFTDVSGSLNEISLPFLMDPELKRKVITQVVSSGLNYEPIVGTDSAVYLLVKKTVEDIKLDLSSEDWKKFISEEQEIVSRRVEKNFLNELKKKSKIEVNDEAFNEIP